MSLMSFKNKNQRAVTAKGRLTLDASPRATVDGPMMAPSNVDVFLGQVWVAK